MVHQSLSTKGCYKYLHQAPDNLACEYTVYKEMSILGLALEELTPPQLGHLEENKNEKEINYRCNSGRCIGCPWSWTIKDTRAKHRCI